MDDMQPQVPGRAWVGFALAPLAAVAAFLASGAAVLALGGEPPATLRALAWPAILFFALFGPPVAYFLGCAIGLPLYLVLAERGRLRPWPFLLVGTAAGGAVVPLLWLLIVGPPFVWRLVLVGALAGAAAGGTFAAVGLERSAARPAV